MLRVLITAGGSGIGRTIAKTFLEAGSRVHVGDISAEAISAMNRQHRNVRSVGADLCTTTVCDCSEAADVERLFADAEENMGGVDVLVNCAGISGPVGEIEGVSLADWQRTLDVNMTANFLCTQRAVPYLKRQKRGAIISLSSTAGLMGCPRRVPYAAAKWALIGMTKSLAMELGPHNIRVNAVCPTSTDGPRIDRVIDEAALRLGTTPDQVRDAWTSQVGGTPACGAAGIQENFSFFFSQ